MPRRSLFRIRLAVASVTALGCGLALATSAHPGAFASFSAETENATSAFAGGWVEKPNAATDPVAGYGATLGWPWLNGAVGVLTQTLYDKDGGTTPAAPTCGAADALATFTVVTTFPSSATTSYTDTGAAADNGHWHCYRIVALHGVWSTPGDFAPLRVGLYPTAVVITNNRTAGQPARNDTVLITFNQNVNAAAGTRMCVFAGAGGTGAILLGDSTCANKATDPATIGRLTGITVGGTGHTSLTVTTTHPAANQVLVTVNANSGINVSGTETYTASASVTSTTGGAAACTAAFCTVAATGAW